MFEAIQREAFLFQKIIRRVRPRTTRASMVGLVISLGLLSIASVSAWRYQNRSSASKPISIQAPANGQVQGVTDGQKTDTPAQPASTDQPGTASTPAVSTPNKRSVSPVSTSSSAQPAQVQPENKSSQPAAITVSLIVNSQSKGSVTVSAGNNQCDVLTQALANRQISSLDMRYNSSLGSYGVYVIDGTGDTSNIWWTYAVNGRSPPQGCSKIQAASGDVIEWRYVKK